MCLRVYSSVRVAQRRFIFVQRSHSKIFRRHQNVVIHLFSLHFSLLLFSRALTLTLCLRVGNGKTIHRKSTQEAKARKKRIIILPKTNRVQFRHRLFATHTISLKINFRRNRSVSPIASHRSLRNEESRKMLAAMKNQQETVLFFIHKNVIPVVWCKLQQTWFQAASRNRTRTVHRWRWSLKWILIYFLINFSEKLKFLENKMCAIFFFSFHWKNLEKDISRENIQLTQRLFRVSVNHRLWSMSMSTSIDFLSIFLLTWHSRQDDMDTPNHPAKKNKQKREKKKNA